MGRVLLHEDNVVSRPGSTCQSRFSSTGPGRKADLMAKHKFSVFQWSPPAARGREHMNGSCSAHERRRSATAPSSLRKSGGLAAAWQLVQDPGHHREIYPRSVTPGGMENAYQRTVTPMRLMTGVAPEGNRSRSDSKDCLTNLVQRPGGSSDASTRKSKRPRRVTFQTDCKAPPPTSLLSLCRAATPAVSSLLGEDELADDSVEADVTKALQRASSCPGIGRRARIVDALEDLCLQEASKAMSPVPGIARPHTPALHVHSWEP